MTNDLIERQAAIDALWKALYEYEDETEKDFQESEELDIGDWFLHRIFVQNMSDIDRNVILNLPSAEPDVPDTNVGDIIIRQAAIDLVESFYKIDKSILNIMVFKLKQLPSAEPVSQFKWERDVAIDQLKKLNYELGEKPRRGKWIPVTNGRGGFECNQCHCYAPSYQDGVEWLSDYCPNCGVDMRGEE